MKTGNLIVRLREGCHKSQKQLAMEAGLDPTVLCHIEKNQRRPYFDVMVRLARALHVSLDDFALGMQEDCVIQITVMPLERTKPSIDQAPKKAKSKQLQ
jgi:transcriptional regulator with XRE-family HTH domain